MKKYFASYWIRSAFYSVSQRFSLALFGVINYIILVRTLPISQMAVWALFLVVTTIFETTKSGLLKNAHIRYVSSRAESGEKTTIASSSLLINASISLLFILVILLLSGGPARLSTMNPRMFGWIPDINPDLMLTLKWYIPGLIGMVILSHFEAIQQSHFDFKGVFAGNLARQFTFFVIILVLTLLHKPLSLQWLALYLSLSMLIGALTIFLFSRKYLLYRFDPTWEWIRKITGYGGYIFGSGMISNIYSNLDQLMMATYSTISSVAYYNSASRITNFAEVPSFAAGEVIFPKVARASHEEGTARVKYLYEKMVAILLSFTIPLGIFVLLFPKFVILVIAGHNYLSAAPILRLYIIISMISPMQNQAANVLNSIGKPGLCFRLNFITLVGKGVITLICIRSLGFYGAAIGTLIASGLGYILWYFVMTKQIGSGLTGIIRNMADLRKTAWVESKKLLLKFRNPADRP